MSRKKAREIALHLIFEMGFQEAPAEELLENRLDETIMQSIGSEIALYAGALSENETAYIVPTVKGVATHRAELDAVIAEHSRGWNVTRISKMSMAIMRLALYEMRYVQDVPVGAAINEAVELAKTYESDEAGAFINGILGTVGRADGAALNGDVSSDDDETSVSDALADMASVGDAAANSGALAGTPSDSGTALDGGASTATALDGEVATAVAATLEGDTAQ